MLDLGVVRPGSTIRIPFNTFDKDDGSSITMTNYAAADILVYKDGSTTERASTSGFTATTDFDSKTGKQLIVIDLSDNTTAGFWAAGSEYLVAVDAVTVDAVTTGGWVARFRIGQPGAWFDTTIATLSTQTSFTLTSGPAEDDALNGHWAIIHDVASAVQCARVLISDYTGSTKTVTLAAGATFTAAAGDNISIMGMAPLQPTTLGNTIDVASGGEAGIDWGNVANKTTTNALTGTTIATTQKVDLETIKTQSVTCSAGVTVSQFVGSTGAAVNGTNANTLSSHDPGATIGTSTLTQTQVTGGAYALNNASFAFHSGLDLTATQKASVNAEVDSALDTAIPVSPTSDSINERLKTLDDAYTATRAGYLDNINNAALSTLTTSTIATDVWGFQVQGLDASVVLAIAAFGGTITTYAVDDAAATSTSFTTNLPLKADGWYADATVAFPATSRMPRVVTNSTTSGGKTLLSFDEAFSEAPTNGDYFTIGGHTHPVSQIQSGLATSAEVAALQSHGDSTWATATGFSTHTAADVWAVATRVLTAGTNIQLPSNGLANVTAWTVNITGSLSGSVGSVTGAVGSVTGNVGGNITGSIGSLASQAKADVNAEVVDALQTDTPVAGVAITEALRRIGTITSGEVAGAGMGTETFTDWAGSVNTIVITVDGSGNRTAITYN